MYSSGEILYNESFLCFSMEPNLPYYPNLSKKESLQVEENFLINQDGCWSSWLFLTLP